MAEEAQHYTSWDEGDEPGTLTGLRERRVGRVQIRRRVRAARDTALHDRVQTKATGEETEGLRQVTMVESEAVK